MRRLDLGLTQAEAATRIGAREATVESWECYGREPHPKFWPGLLSFLGYDPYPTPETLAEKLKAFRRQGWTQRELAEHLGVDPGSITRWERGGAVRKLRDRRTVAKLLGDSYS